VLSIEQKPKFFSVPVYHASVLGTIVDSQGPSQNIEVVALLKSKNRDYVLRALVGSKRTCMVAGIAIFAMASVVFFGLLRLEI
jgi:hypothetical protein